MCAYVYPITSSPAVARAWYNPYIYTYIVLMHESESDINIKDMDWFVPLRPFRLIFNIEKVVGAVSQGGRKLGLVVHGSSTLDIVRRFPLGTIFSLGDSIKSVVRACHIVQI